MASEIPQNWFARNWKWALPAGCLSLVCVIAAIVGVVFLIVMSAIKHSEVYTEAVGRARASAAVRQVLGQPLEEGLLVWGRIRVQTGTGTANLSIPLSGPKGRATLFVHATKTDTKWSFSQLVLTVKDTHERVNLLRKH